MSNKIKDIDIKSCRYYFFNDVIYIKNFDPNKIKIAENRTKRFLFTTLDMRRSKVQNM